MNDKENDVKIYQNPPRNKKATLVLTFLFGVFFLSKIDQLINRNYVLSNTHSHCSDALPFSLHALSL